VRRLAVLVATLVLAATGGSSALGAGALTGHPGDIEFGSLPRGDSVPRTETLENTSGTSVDIQSLAVSGPAFDKGADDCPSTLADGASCEVDVSFSPNSIGPATGLLTVNEGSAGADSFTLTGTATDPIDVQPTSLPFGKQLVGTSSPQQPVTVTNSSDHDIDLNLGLSNPQDYDISGCDGGLGGANVLAHNSSCIVQVVFSPNAEGQQNGTLTVAGHDVSLTGQGTKRTIGVSPGAIAFGLQPIFTHSATRAVTVTNTGSDDLQIGVPTVDGANPLQFSASDNCQTISPLAPGGQCTVTVAFAPTVHGALSATLHVNSDATGGADTVDLQGTGTLSAVVFAPGPVRFKQPHHAGTFSSKRTVTLTNRTSGPLVISRVHLGGQNPGNFRITAGTCAGRTLPSDATCTETVRFAPNDVGVKSASLIVNDDGPNNPHSVQLTARATYPRDDTNVIGAVGCDSTKITFRKGATSRRFARTVIVRSRAHIPRSPNDGKRRPHGVGVLHDNGLRHFTAYQYRVFALYRSHTRPGTYNHSRGVILHLRTGEVCTPKDGAVLRTTTPTASWLRHSTLFGYSFLLFHGEDQVQVKRSVHALQFAFRGRRHLHHGFRYTLFLYAYPPAHPEGISIGRTTFRVR
jgi:HYDIN/CFA65/VesB-like, Ig-like domain